MARNLYIRNLLCQPFFVPLVNSTVGFCIPPRTTVNASREKDNIDWGKLNEEEHSRSIEVTETIFCWQLSPVKV